MLEQMEAIRIILCDVICTVRHISFLIIGFSAITGVNLMMSHASVIRLLTTFNIVDFILS